MIRGLKLLVFSFGATLAFCSASAGIATAHTFHLEGSPSILTGEGTVVARFEFENASAECSKATYSGTKSGSESTEVTLHPVYGGKCALEPFGEAKIDTTGCNYNFGSGTVLFESFGTATMEIECEGSNAIKVTGPLGCTITIPGQKSVGVTYANHGSGVGRDVTFEPTVPFIEYTSNFACQLAGVPAADSFGRIRGSFTVNAFSDGGGFEGSQSGFWVE